MVYQASYTQNEQYPDLLDHIDESVPGVISLISKNRVHMQVHLLADGIVRFRYAQYGQFDSDFSYAIDPDFIPKTPSYKIVDQKESVRISLADFYIRISKEYMKVDILTLDDKVIIQDEKGYHWEENTEHGGNIVQMTKAYQQGEAFYGLGDKPTHLNLHGKRLTNWGTDEYGFDVHKDPIYKNIPFYYGLQNGLGYGIFFDNSFETHFDFASERQNVTSFWSMGGDMNYYYIHGPELMDVARNYASLTGKAKLPPLWSLGYHQSKWSYQPESQVMEIADKMRELKLPCDVIHIDIDYMEGFRCFTWNLENFPDPKGMIQRLHNDGMKVIVIIDPGIKIDFNYDVFREGFEKGYFCKRADGAYIKGKVWPGDCYFPDFTRPEVRDWWAGLYKGLIADQKIDGIWNDMNEPALFEVPSKTFPLDVRHDYDGNPCSHRKAHNIYGMQMARATNEGQIRFAGNNRSLTITRSCYAGAQRFSAGWTGDNIASWSHIWTAAVQCLRLSISGMSFIGADVGGFIMQPTGELYIRFVQLGLFHPFFRTHSSGDHGDQEPWSFGKEYTDFTRSNLELRYRILPYLYTSFYQTSTDGTPFLRPLSFYDQHDQHTTHLNEVFLVGDSLLTAPVITPGATGRNVYVPKGTWYNFWNAEMHEGKKETWIDIPYDKTMMLIKAGSVFPLFPVQQYVGEKDFDYVELRCYFGPYAKGSSKTASDENSFTSKWYEDDGKSYDHESGAYKLHTFHSHTEENKWWITQEVEGDYADAKKEMRMSFVACPWKSYRIEIDGKEAKEVNSLLTAPSNFKEILVMKK